MNATVITNIILSVLSFTLSLISIVFVVISIKQNNKLLELSSRPNLDVMIIPGDFYQIVIKNFGNSTALITDFYISDLSKYYIKFSQLPDVENFNFNDIVGIHIPPQSNVSHFLHNFSDLKSDLEIKVKYTNDLNEYSLHRIINVKEIAKSVTIRDTVTKDNWNIILAENSQRIVNKILKQ